MLIEEYEKQRSILTKKIEDLQIKISKLDEKLIKENCPYKPGDFIESLKIKITHIFVDGFCGRRVWRLMEIERDDNVIRDVEIPINK